MIILKVYKTGEKLVLNVTQSGNATTSHRNKFNLKNIAKKIFFIYKKGFWKFWGIYLASLLIIKGIMLACYYLANYIINNSFYGFSVTQSVYYMQFQDLLFNNVTLGSGIHDNQLITSSLVTYFLLQVVYQAILSIPFVISILLAKNIFDNKNEKLRKQMSDVFLVIGPVLVIGVITSIMVQLGSYFWYLPGVILMAFTSLVFPILVDEKLKPIKTIKRSFKLVQEQFFNILGIIVLIVLGQLAVLGIGKFFAWTLVHDPAVATKLLNVYNTLAILYSYDIVQSIIYSLVAPFTAISSYVIYREALSVRTLDLSAMIDSTAKFAEENNSLAVDKQLTNVVKTETKDLIKATYCENCGAKLEPNALYCPNCGEKV